MFLRRGDDSLLYTVSDRFLAHNCPVLLGSTQCIWISPALRQLFMAGARKLSGPATFIIPVVIRLGDSKKYFVTRECLVMFVC
jgi:hypothetical protein